MTMLGGSGKRTAVPWMLAACLAGGLAMQSSAQAQDRESAGGAPAQVLASVRAYLMERGVPAQAQSLVEAEDLVLPSPPPSHAAVRVSSGRWDAVRQEFQFYLRCSNPRECRPFLVTLHMRNNETSTALRGLASSEPAGNSEREISGRGARPPRATPEAPRLVKAGDRVRLRLAGPGVRIRLEAICLESGVLGQQVRARGVGEARTFRAQVIGPKQLAMEFE